MPLLLILFVPYVPKNYHFLKTQQSEIHTYILNNSGYKIGYIVISVLESFGTKIISKSKPSWTENCTTVNTFGLSWFGPKV